MFDKQSRDIFMKLWMNGMIQAVYLVVDWRKAEFVIY